MAMGIFLSLFLVFFKFRTFRSCGSGESRGDIEGGEEREGEKDAGWVNAWWRDGAERVSGQTTDWRSAAEHRSSSCVVASRGVHYHVCLTLGCCTCYSMSLWGGHSGSRFGFLSHQGDECGGWDGYKQKVQFAAVWDVVVAKWLAIEKHTS